MVEGDDCSCPCRCFFLLLYYDYPFVCLLRLFVP
jgi:hypothetical protein